MSGSDELQRFLSGKNLNPKTLFDNDSYETKGNITNNDRVLYAVSYAIRNTDDFQDETGNFIHGAGKLLREQLLLLSRSVGGSATKSYERSIGVRIPAEDNQKTVQVEGEQ